MAGEVKVERAFREDLLTFLITQRNHEGLFVGTIDGMLCFIGIHSTVLGPALGGCRFTIYESDFDALKDVLRLSEAMTYKAALAGLNLGGGKAVIAGDPVTKKNEYTLRQFGRFVEMLGGRYITAEDVGTSARDMEYIRMETKYVSGLPEEMGGGGDPSPVTAYGVYVGMKAACKYVFGSESLELRSILVQGAGNVGRNLMKLLRKENARVIVADINEERASEVAKEYGCEIIPPEDIFTREVDIFAPCALGGVIKLSTIKKMNFRIIAGAANNQLEDEDKCSRKLLEKGIVYVPDFLINAGGLINCYCELEGYNRKRAMALTERIYDRTLQALSLADKKGVSPYHIAFQMAMERIENVRRLKA